MAMTGKLKLAVLVPAVAALLAIAALTVAIGLPDGPTLAQSSAPAAPTGLTAPSSTHDSVTLSWDDPDDSSITGYQVLRRDTVNQAPGTFTTVESNTGSAVTAYTDSTVAAETRYVYRVKAINASGTSDQSNYVNVETPAAPSPSVPAQPTGLTASSVSHDNVTLTWDDPGDDSITGYLVLRRSRDGEEYGDGQGDTQFVAVVEDTGTSATTYNDTSVTAHRRYVYRVKAINSKGMGERSTYLNVETPEEPTPEPTPTPTVPAAPTGLTATSVSHDSVTLSWDDPGDTSITGYQVLRRSRDRDDYGDGLGAAEFEVIREDTGSSASTYTDGSVEAGTRYAYAVKARNAEGLGETSDAVDVETSEAPASQPVTGEQTAQPCEDGYVPPTPTDIAVTVAPIVVESTVDDYFVLYASHDVDGETVWYPVLVKRGEDGTTTLSENVAALPVERYRVEKYLVAEPAGVDGDCTDDITELNNLGAMNPVNPGSPIESALGGVALPDRETFEAFATSVPGGIWHMKFVLVHMDNDRPTVYFMNATGLRAHTDLLSHIGASPSDLVKGVMVYDPERVASDGSSGVFRYRISNPHSSSSFDFHERVYTLLAASMPVLNGNLEKWVRSGTIPAIQDDMPLYEASRVDLVFDADIEGYRSFMALNPGEGYGLLREMDPDERPHSRDVVIYEALPNELPRVAGIISTVPQTPLSHVNLRALQDGVPNAFIPGVLDDEGISDLIDRHVYYAVTESGYTIRAATQAEVDAHYASARPAELQVPQRDLSVTAITPLSSISFEDWDSFGVKAANVAVLGTLGFPEGTVPEGFAVPFYFYDEFMKHNGLYDDVSEMLADPDFQSDYDTKVDELKKLRKKIKKAETPEWIETALAAMHETFPEGTSLRYRSSTNNEDLPNFNGAGLYDSKTQHPDETEEDGISKSLKQVYASLWNFRAFIERDFHRVDHLAAAMGVLVHPNYSDELVNGVAVSVDPAYGTDDNYYVNSQLGENLVTNPEAHAVPEEVLLHADGTNTVVALSNQAPLGQLLMTGGQMAQLRRHLAEIHTRFAGLYRAGNGEQFAMEVEFKITSDNILAIKQARPWIFADPSPTIEDAFTADTGPALTGRFETVPATHDGNPFTLRVLFNERLVIGGYGFRDKRVSVTGGRVTRYDRVNGRLDWWEFEITPDSAIADVTIAFANNIPCVIRVAICSASGRRLSNRLEHTVRPRLPAMPDGAKARQLSQNTMDLAWNDALWADSYEVQLLDGGRWIDLPANGIDIAFAEGGAAVTSLPALDRYAFRVRAVNSLGASAWTPQFIAGVVVLEGELVAAVDDAVSPAVVGYAPVGSLGGTLSPSGFVSDGVRHEVNLLVQARGSVWLSVDPALPAGFALVVGGRAYRGGASRVPVLQLPGEGYWWPVRGRDWVGGAVVDVSLVLHEALPLPDRAPAPVTGNFSKFQAQHDGSDFTVWLYFSEAVAVTAEALRDHVLSVSGGTVSAVDPIDDEGRIWMVTVTPRRWVPTTVGIAAGLDCGLPEAVCTGDGRRLFNSIELTVAAEANYPPEGVPTIDGTPHAGETLSVDTSNITDADGMDGAAFSYQWIRNDGQFDEPIAGATGATYTLSDADEGSALRVQVFFIDDAGKPESVTSGPVRSERPHRLQATESNGAVVLTWKLPADWSHGSTLQILRSRPELGETEPLVHSRYTQGAATAYSDTDVEPGVLYVYRVQGVDPFGSAGEASRPFEIRTAGPATVDEPAPESNDHNSPATGPPSIRRVARVGATLRASLSNLDDADGLSGATFNYQWFVDGWHIPGATGSTYSPVAGDAGMTITVRVSFTDDEGNEESLTSEPTAAVAP